MMTYDPDRHHRRSIRLRGVDYRHAGAYFVTICVQDRRILFGEIVADEMRLNDAGRMVERWWGELARKFPGVRTDAFVVMPDHVHGIIMIREGNDADPSNPNVNESNENATVGADPWIRPPQDNNDIDDTNTAHVDSIADSDVINVGGYADPPLRNDFDDTGANNNEFNENATVGADVPIRQPRDDAEFGADSVDPVANANDPRVRFNASLSDIIQWFKIMTTNEYIRGVKHSGWPPFRKRVWQRDYYEQIIRGDEVLARVRRYILDNPARWAQDSDNPQKRKSR
jgi:putative transposase